MNYRRMLVRKVAPNGLMLVSLLGTQPKTPSERVRLARLLFHWWDRAQAVARKLDLDASLKMAYGAPFREAQRSYTVKSKRAECLWRGVRAVRDKVEELVIEAMRAI